jgi:hypothetical protein
MDNLAETELKSQTGFQNSWCCRTTYQTSVRDIQTTAGALNLHPLTVRARTPLTPQVVTISWAATHVPDNFAAT